MSSPFRMLAAKSITLVRLWNDTIDILQLHGLLLDTDGRLSSVI